MKVSVPARHARCDAASALASCLYHPPRKLRQRHCGVLIDDRHFYDCFMEADESPKNELGAKEQRWRRIVSMTADCVSDQLEGSLAIYSRRHQPPTTSAASKLSSVSALDRTIRRAGSPFQSLQRPSISKRYLGSFAFSLRCADCLTPFPPQPCKPSPRRTIQLLWSQQLDRARYTPVQ